MRRPSSLVRACFALAAIALGSPGSTGCKREEKAAPAPMTKQELAKAAVQELAGPAYQQWAAANPNRPCPSIDELVKYAPRLALDPWGQPYRARCTAEALAGKAREVMIHSNGPDGLTNTDDDVKAK